ncbi:MAG TPA: DUF378 domain-containing protein [Acidimicrobiales bacterium]|jgi:uncharacterized membrane protein YuzA (DUF378 family)|nr:DUF378 domain-containing protein [Acidimicrobiales bacterium]
MRLHRKKGWTAQLTPVDEVAGAMLALGALNWGLVGTANFDVIRAVFGRTAAARAAYGLIGASAAYAFVRGRRLAHG